MIDLLVEFIGTFIFLSVILNATAKNSPMASYAPLAIGLALTVVIQFGGIVSGAHFNPAVSIMMNFNNSLPNSDLLFYIMAQVLGGIAALKFFNIHKKLM
jgi:glycerol uptake facilitator-like aquaporin